MADDRQDKLLRDFQAFMKAFGETRPRIVGSIGILVEVDETGDPVYTMVGIGHGEKPFTFRHAEDALCEAIAWNRTLEEEAKAAHRAEQQGKAPTVEGTMAVN